MKVFQIGLAIAMMAGTAAVQADSVNNQHNEPVVSQYEFSSVSYGSNQDGNTYSRVVTMHNGVKDSDITTVNGVVSNVLWDKNSQGKTAPGYIQGVGLKDGNVTANAVAAKNIQASSGSIGNLYGNHLTVPTAVLGGVTFGGNGGISGVQTNSSDLTSAVSVQYLKDYLAVSQSSTSMQNSLAKALSDLQMKVTKLENEKKQLKAEIESLKK